MNTAHAITILSRLIHASLPVLLVGAPGVGKSDIVGQAATDSGADLIVTHPAVADPTDAKGLPWPDKDNQTARFLPFGELARALGATTPTVWFLDDLGQATPAVQASYMQLLLARRVNGHALPACVTFVAATNRRSDRAGVSGILEPVKSRFATILEVEPDLDSWCAWAYGAGMPGELIAFLRFRPELLHRFEPSMDVVNSPCPRTWAYVGKMLSAGIPNGLEHPCIKGAVGEAGATEFVSFLRLWRELPSPDAVLLDPASARMPTEPSALYAITVALAKRASATNFGRIAKYAMRLNDAGHGEFAALLLRDCVRQCAAIQSTADFAAMAAGPLGKLYA